MGALGFLKDFAEILGDGFGIFKSFGVFGNLFREDSYGISAEYLPDYKYLSAKDYYGLPADAKRILEAGEQESAELEQYIKLLNKPVKQQIRPQGPVRADSRLKLPSDKVRGEDRPKEESLDEKTRESED